MPQPTPDAARPKLSIDALLEHSDWLQTLARRLARDEGRAQDLVQKVWVAALRKPPEDRGDSPRGWLGKVLRTEALLGRRADQRRRDREELRAQELRGKGAPAARSDAAGLEERLELQAQILAAVRQLEEPIRTVVLLRYFEQQPLGVIAERTGAPIRTVEARLRRGRELLRGQLDAGFGSRAAWTALAAPLSIPFSTPHSALGEASEGASSAASGVSVARATAFTVSSIVVMGSKFIFAVAAAVLALVIGFRVVEDAPSPEGGDAVASAEGGERTADEPGQADLLAIESSDPARVSGESIESAGGSQAESPVLRPYFIQGRAFHGDGRPYAGLALKLKPALGGFDRTTTSPRGELELEVELPAKARARLIPSSGNHIILASRPISIEEGEQELPGFLAVSPGTALAGTVVSSSGDPIEGAKLSMELPGAFAARFSDSFWHVEMETWEATSAADGAFLFSSVPALEGCLLKVEAGGHKVASRVVPQGAFASGGGEALEIVLESIDPRAVISGIVVDPDGKPIEGAKVALESAMRNTGEDGRFEFEPIDKQAFRRGPPRLRAAAKGWQWITYEPALDGGGDAIWPALVELRFTREVVSLSGVLLDAAGEPKAGGWVWLEDPTVIGVSDGSALTAEYLMGDRRYSWQKYPTDSEGRFEIPGLTDRVYKVRGADLETMHLSVPQEARGGADECRLQLDPSVPVARVAGRLVDGRGKGIAGASVALRRMVLLLNHPNGSSANLEHAKTEVMKTGSDGRFDFGVLPLHPKTDLYLYKKGYTLKEIDLSTLPGPLDQQEISLDARCRARIVAGDLGPVTPTSARLLSASGEELQATIAMENGAEYSKRVQLSEGNSKTFNVSGAAVEAVLYAEGKVVARIPLRLEPEGINEIRP